METGYCKKFQYKSKIPFYYLRKMSCDSDTPIKRCFFGSCHGKNLGDALGGTIKLAAKREVKAHRVVISNTTHMFKFCEEKLKEPAENETTPTTCIHKKRWFPLVKKDDVKENPLQSWMRLKAPGKSTACFQWDILSVHHFTCFCHACSREEYDACEVTDHVQAWQKIKTRQPKKTTHETSYRESPHQDPSREKKEDKKSK